MSGLQDNRKNLFERLYSPEIQVHLLKKDAKEAMKGAIRNFSSASVLGVVAVVASQTETERPQAQDVYEILALTGGSMGVVLGLVGALKISQSIESRKQAMKIERDLQI